VLQRVAEGGGGDSRRAVAESDPVTGDRVGIEVDVVEAAGGVRRQGAGRTADGRGEVRRRLDPVPQVSAADPRTVGPVHHHADLDVAVPGGLGVGVRGRAGGGGGGGAVAEVEGVREPVQRVRPRIAQLRDGGGRNTDVPGLPAGVHVDPAHSERVLGSTRPAASTRDEHSAAPPSFGRAGPPSCVQGYSDYGYPSVVGLDTESLSRSPRAEVTVQHLGVANGRKQGGHGGSRVVGLGRWRSGRGSRGQDGGCYRQGDNCK
jgi:hypothetical protein